MANLITGACLGECVANLPDEAEFPTQEYIEQKMAEMTLNDIDYYMWIPGYKYQHSLKKRIDSARSASTEEVEETVEQPVVEKSEIQKLFESKAVSDKVPIKEVANMLRTLGYAPTIAEMEESAEMFGDSLTLNQFQDICNAFNDTPISLHQLELALRHFDNSGSGKLSKAQWVNIMMNYGEPLTQDEMNKVNAKFSIGDTIDCKTICEKYETILFRVTS